MDTQELKRFLRLHFTVTGAKVIDRSIGLEGGQVRAPYGQLHALFDCRTTSGARVEIDVLLFRVDPAWSKDINMVVGETRALAVLMGEGEDAMKEAIRRKRELDGIRWMYEAGYSFPGQVPNYDHRVAVVGSLERQNVKALLMDPTRIRTGEKAASFIQSWLDKAERVAAANAEEILKRK